jgi:hypothetical protein
VSRTDDAGATWQPPVKAADVPGGGAAAWQAVVRADGALVVFYGNLQTVSFVLGGAGVYAGPTSAQAVVSADGGATWSAPSSIVLIPNYMLARAAAAPDGSLWFVWNELSGTTATVKVARSADGGATWQAPVTAATFADDVLGSAGVEPDIAVNASGSIGVSFYADGPGGGRAARMLAHSSDGGTTWTVQQLAPPFVYNPGGTGNGDGPVGAYQGIAAAGTGFGTTFVTTTGDSANPTEVVYVRASP